MTKQELIAALANVPDDAPVLIDIKAWDEPLNLTAVHAVHAYGLKVTPADQFAVLVPSQVGATRLDPNGAE